MHKSISCNAIIKVITLQKYAALGEGLVTNVTGFAKTVPTGTTMKSILWLDIEATLSYYPGTPSTWV